MGQEERSARQAGERWLERNRDERQRPVSILHLFAQRWTGLHARTPEAWRLYTHGGVQVVPVDAAHFEMLELEPAEQLARALG